MESEWRLNVWRIGWAWEKATLAAELREFPGIYLTNDVRTTGRYRLLHLDPAGWQPWVSDGTYFIPTDHPHFPYGLDVNPDEHG